MCWYPISVWKSGPRTNERPRTRLDWTNLGLDCGPGPTPLCDALVLVLDFFGLLKDRSWTSLDQYFCLFEGAQLVIVCCAKCIYFNVKNVQNKHFVKMCKCRVAICDYKILILVYCVQNSIIWMSKTHKTSTWSKCANVGLPFVVYNTLILVYVVQNYII